MPILKKRNVWHEVQGDEDIQVIAAQYGIKNWKFVYDHEQNKALRSQRPNPHILYRGDRVWIPEIQPKEFEVDQNKTHKFILYSPKSLIHLFLKDDDEKPYSNVKYELWIDKKKYNPSGSEVELRTPENGLVHHMVPLSQDIELRVWLPNSDPEDGELDNELRDYMAIALLPGHLDPINTIEGVQDRLINLSYPCGSDKRGEWGEGSRAALRSFQEAVGLVPTGEIDDLTRQKLVEKFGT